MSPIDSASVTNRLEAAASAASCELARLAGVYGSLRLLDDVAVSAPILGPKGVCGRKQLRMSTARDLLAERVLTCPGELRYGVPEDEKERCVSALLTLGDVALRSGLLSSDGEARFTSVGFLNKSAVIHAVGTVEEFLVRSFEARFARRIWNFGLTGLIKVVSSGKCSKGDLLQEPWIPCYSKDKEHMRFLAQMRHAIVHQDCRATSQILSSLVSNRDNGIWPKDSDLRSEIKRNGGRVILSITKVVIPYLARAAEFVESSRQAFILEAGNPRPGLKLAPRAEPFCFGEDV